MNILHQKRKEKGLTQLELARLAGVNHQSIISDIENGRRNPKFELMKRLAFALNENVSNLFLL